MPTPNFEDAPDGSSSVNHTGSAFSEEVQCFWEDIDPWADIQPYPTNPVGYSREFPPHPSYADGSAPLMTATEVNEARRRENPEWRPIPARPRVEDYVPPAPVPATPLPRTAREMLQEASERFTTAIDTSPQVCDPSPRRTNRRRRGISDPDAAIRKDPNAWSLREAVELCKLLEVVVPEAGFHIALTGGLLYKEGRRKDCDLMFYQIRGTEPNYEVLWKYLTVAGVIRSPSYPENGWLVKATYRGKAIDCLFPNAKKAKKAGAAKDDCYKFTPPPTGAPTIADAPACVQEEAFRPPTPREQALLRNAGIITAPAPVLVHHNDGAPILYRRSPDAPGPYDPAELLAASAPAPIPQYPPVNLENGVTVRYDPATRSFRTEEPPLLLRRDPSAQCRICGLDGCPGC